MSRWLSFLVFFGIMLAVVAGWHWYLWLRLVRDPQWPPVVSRVLTVLLVLLAISMPVGMIGSRLLPPRVAEVLAMVVYLWMGAGFLLLVIVAGVDLARGLLWGVDKAWTSLFPPGPDLSLEDPARRQLFFRTAAAVAGAGASAVALHGLKGALGEIQVKTVEVPLARLPKALDGYTLVQLTDVHVGPLIGRRFVEGLVERVGAMKPDAVVITGDLVDGSPARLQDQVAPLARLGGRDGVFFVTGNHEYYSGAPAWNEALTRMGIQVLENQRVPLGDRGPGGASFDLVGIPDITGRQMGPVGPDLPQALDGRDPDRELILLAHQPKAIEVAARHQVGLQLSGHTHGGQIQPFGALVALAQPYVAGLHHHPGTDTRIYVSRGTGFWGPPMRVGAPAEITRVVLVAA